MRKMLARALCAAALLVGAPAAAQDRCERACLAGHLDAFLGAVVAHDPARAGLWTGFRQTQNAILTAPGDGIWASNSGLGTLDRRYYDPETGGAEFYGTMKEGAERAIVSLRLKVARGKVTEAEWHIARVGDVDIYGVPSKTSTNVDNLLANPPSARTVPVAERFGRDELIAAVNSYFDGITANTGEHVQAIPGCMRLENGVGGPDWTGRPAWEEDRGWQETTDCRSGYPRLGIINVSARRYLMVDEEAQVVIASAIFQREPLNPKRRNCFMEIFYLDGGRISAVYAAMVYAPPSTPLPNWAPYDGNFPVPQTLVAPN